MKKNEATRIVEDVFKNKFSEDNFQTFIVNLLKNYTAVGKVREGQYIREAYRSFVTKYKVVGTYIDSDDSSVDILCVHLNKETSLERARTAQRNFIADYLKNTTQGKRDAALVAFVSPTEVDWRFSFVKLEYSLELIEGNIQANENLTMAKRYSFLVGKNEGAHTVLSRFVPLIESDSDPKLKELEDAFSIEKVTNEFFEKYCELFHEMNDSLVKLIAKDGSLRKDFESKEISTSDFTKKTLGQMAFLYFLQKKGWFGVAPNKPWGSGPKNFIRELFKRKEKYGKNFFNDVLEPLFYEALAQDRGSESIYPRLNNCRMPFLNGGLFEPMNGYSWETTDVFLPDSLFSNSNKTQEGDEGDGILDVFDRYNFTVNENEPLEKEVAVDPEMLGKVFENLLEIEDRKSKGAFYTPREIVHYMCQESIINFLHSSLSDEVERTDIANFIHRGTSHLQNEAMVLERGKETDTYKFILPESIRNSAREIDVLLSNIKVCDPAVGSGAFPLGMLNEVVRARQVLSILLKNKISQYELKLHTISHSIYGVDIDSGAVEIAKLRLWLALVVEERDPLPLPNLDYKIMQGNSLLAEYEGIKLFDDSFLENAKNADNEKNEVARKLSQLQKEYFELHFQEKLTDIKEHEFKKQIKQLQKRQSAFAKKSLDEPTEMGLFDEVSKHRIINEKTERLQRYVEEFVSESRRTNKQNLKEKIDNLKWELIESALEEQGMESKVTEVKKLRKRNVKPFFIWKLEFSDVFKEKDGFDVVIANPPYIGQKNNNDIFQMVKKSSLGKRFHQRRMDYFYFFFHIALDMAKVNGVIAFITTNYYLTATYADKLRLDLKERSILRELINFNEFKIFESAMGQHNIISILSKGQNNSENVRCRLVNRKGFATGNVLNEMLYHKQFDVLETITSNKEIYEGESSYIRFKLESAGEVGGEKIFEKMLNDSEPLESCCDLVEGIHTGADKVSDKHLEKYSIDASKGEGIYVLSLAEVNRLKLNAEEKKMIRPWFKNSDIKRWQSETKATKLLIYYNSKEKYKSVGSIQSHLNRFKSILVNRKTRSGTGTITDNEYDAFVAGKKEISYVMNASAFKRGDFYCVSYPREPRVFESEKIIVPQRSVRNTFAYNNSSWYASADVYFIIQNESAKYCLKFLLGLLNSKLFYFWLYNKGKRKGESLELYIRPLSEIPIKRFDKAIQHRITEIVEKIIESGSNNRQILVYEKDLNEIVYNIYGLSEDEVKIVEAVYSKELSLAVNDINSTNDDE